jgi:hypothetical protein
VTRSRFPRVLGGIAIVYLLGMAAVFSLLSMQSSVFVREARDTTGTVVALVPRAPLGSTREPTEDARSPSLAPKVTYTVDGRSYTYTAAHGRYRQRLRVGDTVAIQYAPDDPSQARLRGEGQAVGPLVSVGFALGAMLVALVLVRTRKRRRRQPRDAVGERALEERSSPGVS